MDELLRDPQIDTLAQTNGRAPTLDAARAALELLRAEIVAGDLDEAEIKAQLEGCREPSSNACSNRLPVPCARSSMLPALSCTPILDARR